MVWDNVFYNELMKLGITKKQFVKGAHILEHSSGYNTTEEVIEEVRWLKMENKKLKSQFPQKAMLPLQVRPTLHVDNPII